MTPRARTMLDQLYASDAAQRQAGLGREQRTRNVDHETGRFLHILAMSGRHRRILEIGSSNGVSTIWFASAMAEIDGYVTGTEILPARAAEANANLGAAGLSDYASVLAVDAIELPAEVHGPFDLVFIDAEKDDYVTHLRTVLPLVRPAGLIVADNVISHDVSAYQALLKSLSNLETLTLPLERGLEVTLKL